jgi:hypothetical protein
MKKLFLILGAIITTAQLSGQYDAINSNATDSSGIDNPSSTGSLVNDSSGRYIGGVKNSNRNHDQAKALPNEAESGSSTIPKGNPASINSITNAGPTDVNNSYVRGAESSDDIKE